MNHYFRRANTNVGAAAMRAHDAIHELRESTVAFERLFDEEQQVHMEERKALIDAERCLDILKDAFTILEAGGSAEAFVDTAYVAMQRRRPPTVKLLMLTGDRAIASVA